MKIVKKYIEILTYYNYSEKTIDTYSCYLEKCLSELNINPYHITTKVIEEYLISKKYSSISQQNQIIGCLKLFAKYILGKKDIHLNKIQRPRKEKKLPKVIDAELLSTKIKAIENLKHKAILALGLSCGLRISEVINLKWEDLDRDRNILNVINGKGKKDRCCKLNDDLIALLKQYWHTFKRIDLQLNQKEYVFVGQNKPQYSASSIQKLVKKYISIKASFHYLRHAYATYALDNGTEMWALSNSLGHNSTKTTESFYAHVSNRSIKTIKQAI